jgi:hypothetical protein
MKQSTVLWSVVILVAGIYLLFRTASGEMGLVYVKDVEVRPAGTEISWVKQEKIDARERGAPNVRVSPSRTVGIWVASLFTLCALSFLWGDNVAYKLAEAVFVGSSAAYWAVVSFWTAVVGTLGVKLTPDLMRESFLPGLRAAELPDYYYLVPLVLSVMLLWQLVPWGGWISRWSVAFFIGAFAGMRLVAYFSADFVEQIRSTILPLVVFAKDNSFDFGASLKNLTILLSVLAGLVYFFFSFEHKGVVGRISRVGIWVLMITFGASFGYTVMGRIALLAARVEFLFDDWLWLIDPALRRVGM